MRKFWTLLIREVRSYFYSPIAYIVMIFFLIISGIDFYFQVSFMNQRQVQYTIQEAFFNSVFFWFAFVLIFPLITMRLFAEEFKLGTIEPLTTAPVRDWQVVLSKFFGALVFYLILWIPTLVYFWIFARVTNQPAAHSPGAYIGSYPEPDYCCDHFFLRNNSSIFPRSRTIHSARRNLHDPRFAGIFFCHRTHGHVLPRYHRYAADRSLREHDRCHPSAHVSGLPVPEMEALRDG